jgi:signal-transduction protein with cAMP-binding, CBS, and nucleotidyltransferase domain/predicted metal-dependent phosphoesterase TrpH/PAS domain-containing protein
MGEKIKAGAGRERAIDRISAKVLWWGSPLEGPGSEVPESIRINLHGHSHLSDGELTPDQLAERLAAAGVRTAALTDHDTIEGLPAFREALTRKGVGFVTGVELTVTDPEEGEKHILGYGFDPGNKALRDLLGRAAGNRRPSYLQALSSAFDRSRSPADRPDAAGGRTAPGAISPADAIRILHEAEGLAVLAHPVAPGQKPDFAALERLVSRLKAQGLDGIEAYYSGYSADLSRDLVALAGRHGLLVSAGSDYHGPGLPGSTELAVDMPLALWRSFRDGLLRRGGGTPGRPALRESTEHRPLPRPSWNSFLLRILLPTALAIGLFVGFLFRILIPAFEDRLLERKRDTIRELTNVASGILSEYDADVRAGRQALAEAQRTAAGRIQDLRYGSEGKDYFWITDMHVRMIMHPYRTDLNGRDVSDFQDPRGVRIFVEFANVLRDRDDAYVEYVWQWKDDPDRLEPKQSYIKKFTPWGWILGTGIYLEDVKREIRAMAARFVRVSIGITVLCAMLLLFVATQSMRIERRRAKAEDELRESHEKYRMLVESVTEGILMVLDGRPAFANPTMLDLLDITADELRLLDLVEVLPEGFAARIPGPNGVKAEEAVLRRRDGSGVDVALTATRISFAGREGVVVAARPLRSHRREEGAALARDRDRENLLGDLQASLMFLHEPIAPLANPPVFCDMRDPVSKGASLMTARGASAVVVTADGEPVGLVTDTDIRARLVAGGLPPDRPLLSIMSAPLVSIEARALVYEAILAMREKDVDHLIVRDETGQVAGVVRHRELLLFHRYSLAVLTQEIRHAPSAEAIAAARRGLPSLVKVLVEGGAKARNITRAVTAVTDAVVIRLLELGAAGLGPAPARFSFIALGSEGREEQTLASDQDHAIIFEDVPEEAEADVQAYFLKLGKFVSDGMALSGYPLCLGEIMSSNPRWCQPLRTWKRCFAEWLGTAEPKDILDLKIFFDFRTIHGEMEFAAELRRHIDEVLGQEPPFLLHYAQYTLQYKAPLSFFGHIVLDEGKEGLRTFNIKDAMMPVVNFARLYAFRHGVAGVNTLDRLHALLDVGTIRETLHDEAVKVYDYLMELRLAHQAQALDRGAAPGNDIDPRELTHLEETLLKQAFAQIANIQKKISFDFLGSA